MSKPWTVVLDTALTAPFRPGTLPANGGYPLQGRSLALLQEIAG
jgi:hypothetical protein